MLLGPSATGEVAAIVIWEFSGASLAYAALDQRTVA